MRLQKCRINSTGMVRESSAPSEDYPDEGGIPQMPRATELLMKLRNQEIKPSWGMVVPCLINLGMAASYLILDGVRSLSNVAFWLGIAVLFFVVERWDRQRKRDKIVSELLGELVAENNRLRRLVPDDSR